MTTDTPETIEPSNGVAAAPAPVLNEVPTVPTKKAHRKHVESPAAVAVEPPATVATPAVESSAAMPPAAVTAPAAEPAPLPPASEPTTMRARLKVWTDSVTGQRFLAPCAVLTPQGLMVITAISEEGAVRNVSLTAAEWNALPFYYFSADGEAPRRLEKLSGGKR